MATTAVPARALKPRADQGESSVQAYHWMSPLGCFPKGFCRVSGWLSYAECILPRDPANPCSTEQVLFIGLAVLFDQVFHLGDGLLGRQALCRYFLDVLIDDRSDGFLPTGVFICGKRNDLIAQAEAVLTSFLVQLIPCFPVNIDPLGC